MNKTTIHIVCIIVLIGAMMVTPASAKTWYVHNSESINDYTGYNGAYWGEVSSGDTIFIYNGTNYGPFNIDKPNINVIGEGADVVTVVCMGSEIRMPDGNGDATGSVLDGIKVVNSNHGIMVGYYGSPPGPGPNTTIRNCVFDGMTATPSLHLDAENITFENNVVSNQTGDGALFGVILRGNNTTFRNNVLRDSTTLYGVLKTEEAGGLIIANNSFINNSGAAMFVYQAPNSIITRNNFSSSGGDVLIYDPGEGIKWYLNNFGTSVGDPWGGAIPAVTHWNSTEPITYTYNPTCTNYLGNYWGAAYGGTDGDGDGIGDTSYTVPYGPGYDYHPLVEPFENYPEPSPQIDLEFGDAPDPTYPSNLSSDGSRHTPTDTECLGLAINGTDWKDFELDARVPDLDIPFDDGLPALALTTGNPAQTVDFEVTNNITDDTLLVNILLDLNGDGDWNDVVGTQSEHVVQNQPITPLVGPADGTFTSTAFSTVGATDGSTWMRITLTRQPISTDWNGTMASAGYAEPFGCGETEDWEVMLEEMIIPSVETATGTGTTTFESGAGTIVDLTAVAEGTLPAEGKPVGMTFPHGFFSFNITGLADGQTVTVTITLPDAVPVGTQYWKYIGSAWVQIPIGSDNGDNVITIQLTDGGPGDADGLADGTIVDPGGSGTPPTPPEVPAMTPIGFVMVMFSLFGLVVFATKGVNKR